MFVFLFSQMFELILMLGRELLVQNVKLLAIHVALGRAASELVHTTSGVSVVIPLS